MECGRPLAGRVRDRTATGRRVVGRAEGWGTPQIMGPYFLEDGTRPICPAHEIPRYH
jgi:hypothetical protein